MKYCTSCQLLVGEPFDHCPLCQNELEATEEPKKQDYPHFPPVAAKLKALSMFFRVQLFIVVSIGILLLAIDYMFGANDGKHWSLIAAVWLIGIELLVMPVFRRRSIPVYFVTDIALVLAGAGLFTAYYIDRVFICTHYQIPSLLLFTLTFNFISSLVDKKGNALVFSICNVLIGIIPTLIIWFVTGEAPILWKVCLLVSCIMLVALIVFKGRKVRSELQKRLNI